MQVEPCPWPQCIPRVRAGNNAKGAGIRYERRVGKLLRETFGTHCHSGQWFKYTSAEGRSRFCQPDHFINLREAVLCIECKLSESEAGWAQLENLYGPVLAAHFGLPVVLIQACRHLRWGQVPITSLKEAKLGARNLWHLLI